MARPIIARIVVALTLVAAALVAVMSWRSSEALPPAGLVCQSPMYDFGQVCSDTAIEHAFVISNRGGRPVTSLTAMPDCGCITTRLSADSLAPASQMTLWVHADVQKYRGSVEKRVYLSGEGGGRPLVLVLRGSVCD